MIEKERIFTENSNRAHGFGELNIATFEPFPKNPPISKVFREIGLADELGSGMRNTYKYTRLYSNAVPIFKENDIFRTIIPLKEAATVTVGPCYSYGTEVSTEVSTEVNRKMTVDIKREIKLSSDKLSALIEFCSVPRSRKEMQEFCGIRTAEYFRKFIVKPMIENRIIELTIPDKPNSRYQKYVRIEKRNDKDDGGTSEDNRIGNDCKE